LVLLGRLVSGGIQFSYVFFLVFVFWRGVFGGSWFFVAVFFVVVVFFRWFFLFFCLYDLFVGHCLSRTEFSLMLFQSPSPLSVSSSRAMVRSFGFFFFLLGLVFQRFAFSSVHPRFDRIEILSFTDFQGPLNC